MPRHRVAPPDRAAPRSGQSITGSEDLNLRRRRKALAGEECSGGTKQPRLPRNTGTKGSCLAAAFPTGRASRRRPARATARQERRGEVAAGLGFGSRPVTHGGEGGERDGLFFFQVTPLWMVQSLLKRTGFPRTELRLLAPRW
jgi:hypothetical protein